MGAASPDVSHHAALDARMVRAARGLRIPANGLAGLLAFSLFANRIRLDQLSGGTPVPAG